jgi:predicted nucleotidyltransferase
MKRSRPLKASALESDFHRLAGERRSLALPRALKALRDLEAIGLRAWVVGSLAKGRFTPTSDVDFAVDCAPEREHDAFRTIETAMGAFPFHMIPRSRIVEDALPMMMEGALDASGLVSRQAQAR